MFVSYKQAIDYLYANVPVFQRIGAAAYKADLHNTRELLSVVGNPERTFRSIHVAGTNGKGSSSHMLASILQSEGYKTGLYTSPHLKDFTERIKINGVDVDQPFVLDFVNRIHPTIERIQPSFFEITVAMAFGYFAKQQVDIAVIEVGLGGRLDSTNVITPIVSLITNISWDHKDLLGDTLEKIAGEKAGIIKKGVPVVISERQPETAQVFISKAKEENAPIVFAADTITCKLDHDHLQVKEGESIILSVNAFPLRGVYQERNVPGVIKTIEVLRSVGVGIGDKSVVEGLQKVVLQTGLKGRWQTIAQSPLTICDTAHNEAGIAEVIKQISREKYQKLFVVIGMVKDKDISGVLKLFPKDASYFFCEAHIPRAMKAQDLSDLALSFGLHGTVIAEVNEAIARARSEASKNDFVFVGGSTFVVAEISEL